MISGNRTHLSSYLTGLLSSGRAVFSRDEAGVTWGAVPVRSSMRRSVSSAWGTS